MKKLLKFLMKLPSVLINERHLQQNWGRKPPFFLSNYQSQIHIPNILHLDLT